MVAGQKKAFRIVLLATALFLGACGGGSGGGVSNGSSSNGVGGNSGGVDVSNTASSPAELNVGDLFYIDLQKENSADFSKVSDNAEFLLVVANTSVGSGSLTMQMIGDLNDLGKELAYSLGVEDEPEEDFYNETGFEEVFDDFSSDFHAALSFREKELEGREIPASFSLSKGVGDVDFAVSKGDQKSFKVLASLSSSNVVTSVDATAECVGSRVVFYIDDRVTNAMLSNADIQELCNRFDSDAGKEYSLLGEASDVNGDGLVTVLMTPQVNKLGALGGGIITGFFNASDLYNGSASNNQEILHVMVPDPSGQYGTAISNAFAMSNLLPTVLVHELQHAISYNQHVIVKGANSEEAWLNEGMSHLMEDLMGHNQENPSRYAIFLRNPYLYPLVTSGSPGLASRGGAYLFMRYMYEQADDGDAFMKKLIQTSNKGASNVEAAFGETVSDFDGFGEFFLRWTIALALTDRGVSADRRYTYQPRVASSGTGNYSGVCIDCVASDNRGTAVNGISTKFYQGSSYNTLQATTARFYQVNNVASTLHFNDFNSAAHGFGVLIRTK